MKLKADISERIESLDKVIAGLKRTEQEYAAGFSEENEFITCFKNYGNIERLTRPMLLELIDEIYVYEGGDIRIVFKFQDAFEKAVRYIDMNKDIIRTA